MSFLSPKCSVCYEDYTLTTRVPRNVPKCGHTFCTECITRMLSQSSEGFRCPNDNRRFDDLKSLSDFPENYLMKALIEEVNGLETCPEHSKVMEYACLSHKIKVCDRCAIFGAHSHRPEHNVKLLSDLVSEVKDKISGLESVLKEATELREKNSEEVEKRRKGLLQVIQTRFDEMVFNIRAKERQLTLEVNSLCQEEISNIRHISVQELQVQKEIEAKILTYKNIAKASDPFSLIDENIGAICSKMEAALQGIKLPEVLEDIQGNLDSTLKAQVSSISQIELSEKKQRNLKSEVPAFDHQIWPEKAKKISHKMTDSPFSADFTSQEGLVIRYDSTKLADFEINLELWQNTNTLSFKIESNLELNLEDIKTLCFIRNRLNKVSFIEISAEGEKNLPSDRMINLLEVLFYKCQDLKGVDIKLLRLLFEEEIIIFLAENILPRIKHLELLNISLFESEVTDKALQVLTKGISSASQSLQTLCFNVSDGGIPEGALLPLFVPMPNIVNYALQINNLSKLSDCALLAFIGKTFVSMKKIKSLNLALGNTKITEASIQRLLDVMSGVMGNMQEFSIDLKGTEVSQEIFEQFKEEMKVQGLKKFDYMVEEKLPKKKLHNPKIFRKTPFIID